MTARLEVHKFGGTSVGDAGRMAAVAELVEAAARDASLVVVASAMTTVTDRLVSAATSAALGDRDGSLAQVAALRDKHAAALDRLRVPDRVEVGAELDRLFDELDELLRAVSHLRELTPRTRDTVLAMGEKLSVRLLAAALRTRGVRAEACDADQFLETDDRFGEAAALPEVADRTIAAALRPRLARGEVPVVTGFTGRAPDGATTTLGRGGSDLTATLVAAALAADEVTIWTDVDGVYSADPRVVPEARVVRQLHYREATEMSYYGARVLHPLTIIPVAARGIAVRIRDSFRPSLEGTVVDGRFTPGSHPVKAVTAVRAHALLALEGKGMAGVPGVAARLFGALAARGISVTVISQSSSESSICLAVPESQADAAEQAVKREFRGDLTRGTVDDVTVRRGVALIAVVGLGMAHSPGVAARVFGALGGRRINVLAIAQGASELNITLAVDGTEADAALRALHEAFGLHRLDTGEDTTRGFDLLLVGVGRIGRAVAELVLHRDAHVFERFGLRARIVGLADRGGFLYAPAGLSRDALRAALDAKSDGRPLATQPGAHAAGDAGALVRHALDYRLARPVVVDLTDDDGTAAVLLAALRGGCDVVTANKKPLAGPLADWLALAGAAREHGRLLRAEATVGAGLPVIDTLEMLLATGDRLRAAEGCLSGTLGFVVTRLERGVAFSQAVREAADAGYTEPDPVADLCGADVARKAVILGRLSGLVENDAPVVLTGLVDGALAGLPRESLFERLREHDAPIAARVAAARERGAVLRYRARIEPGRITVGLAEVPADSPLAGLHGTDNMILFSTDRYDARPLVVSGPGAGVDVTAMGVLGDILRIAGERRPA